MLHNGLQTWHSQSSENSLCSLKCSRFCMWTRRKTPNGCAAGHASLHHLAKQTRTSKEPASCWRKLPPKSSALGQMRWSWGRLAVGGAPQMLAIAALFLRVRLPPGGRQIPFVRLGSLSWLSVCASTGHNCVD